MPNAVQEGIYAQYYTSVVKLAQKDGGVSRPQLIHALGISRTVADGLIARCKLRKSSTKGKTEFFSPSRGSQKVVTQVGGEADSKETTMTEAAPSDPKSLVASVVGDDQPTPAEKTKKTAKNRLPKEDQQPQAQQGAAPAAPEAPAVAPSATISSEIAKSQATLDEEIKAVQEAIRVATNKSNSAFQVYLAQKAHAEALGDRLKTVIAARLNTV